MAVSPEQAAADWVAGLSAKTAKITANAQAVTVAPGQAAARQKTAYQQGVAANVDKWARNTAAVSLQEWQTAFIQKGVPRIATGAQASQAKFAQFMGRLLPYVERGKGQLPARGTFEANVQRSVAWMQYMHGFSNTGQNR